MFKIIRIFASLLRDTVMEYQAKKMPLIAAGLSYFALISISPTLIFITALAGLLGNSYAFQEDLRPHLISLLGENITQSVYILMDKAQSPAGVAASVIGLVVLLLAASRFFVHLQTALNVVWEQKTGTTTTFWGGLKDIFYRRLISFLLIFGTGFFFLLLIGFDILLNLTISLATRYIPIPESAPFWTALGILFATSVLLLLLMAIYRQLPDAPIGWRDVWPGALAALLLMSFIRFLISTYFGAETMASLYGLTGTLVLLLVAISLFIQAFLFGATLNQVYARRFGTHADEIPS